MEIASIFRTRYNSYANENKSRFLIRTAINFYVELLGYAIRDVRIGSIVMNIMGRHFRASLSLTIESVTNNGTGRNGCSRDSLNK